MDTAQKTVLRRRKAAILEAVTIDDQMLSDIRRSGLLTLNDIQQIKGEREINLQKGMLLDFIMASTASDAFQLFLHVLSKNYTWLSRDLEADLKTDQGDYVVEEGIRKNAKMLVHSKFGTSKRLSENDKKDISDLIGLKLQLVKEEYKRQVEQEDCMLDAERRRSETKDEQVQYLDMQLRTFIQKQRRQLTTHAHGMKTTTNVLQLVWEDSEKDAFEKHAENFKAFLDRLAHVLSNKDTLMTERQKCLQMMKETDEKIPLDEAFAQYKQKMLDAHFLNGLAVKPATKSAFSSLAQERPLLVTNKEYDVRRMKKKITALEDDVAKKEAMIDNLEEETKWREEEISSMSVRLQELESKLERHTTAEANGGPRKTRSSKESRRRTTSS